MEDVIKYLENKTILVTGTTGFLGKVFVEKILRVQPNIKKVFVLIKASDQHSALHRLHTEIIGKDLFRIIKEKHGTNMHTFISKKLIPVVGDIGLANFGITNFELLTEMRRQVDVFVSSAAATKFDERYDVAMETNTFGVKHVARFVNECTNIKLLLHVSTAYVSGEKSGIIMETPFKKGETLNGKNNLDIKEENKLIQERHRHLAGEKANEDSISSAMIDFGIQRAKLHGWPNTYVFTKAMGEMILLEELRHDVSLIILRPTIITSTYKEPFPGWIEGIKTIDSYIAASSRGKLSCVLADPAKVLDLIPADMVINALIFAMVAHTKKPYSRTIYHVGSSMSNPMKISTLIDYTYDYFIKHPLVRVGNSISKIRKVKVLTSMSSFKRYVAIRYLLPVKGLKYANMIFSGDFNARYIAADWKIKIAFRLAHLFEPYVLINMIYDDTNLNKLLILVRESVNVENEGLFFDVKSISWEDYLTKIHFPGLVKYAFRK